MKITILTTLACILFGAAFLLQTGLAESKTVRAEPAAPAAPRAQYALLVGINSYKEFTALNGCENDVRMMKDLLVSQYGFKEDTRNQARSDVQTLLSAKATRANILKGLEDQLLKKAEAFYNANGLSPETKGRGANIVFYYSGHGGTLPDIDKQTGKLAYEEADGFDETIIPIDSKQDGTNAIVDDEFDEFYRQISRWTSNVVFVFDSCHSGTVTRAAGQVRRVEFSKYVMPKAVAEEFRQLQAKGRAVGDNANLADGISDKPATRSGDGKDEIGYVTVSGCLPNQLSQEDELPNPDYNAADRTSRKTRWNGLLTYFLVQQLKANPQSTYSDIIKLVQNAVRLKNPTQLPQFEGDIDRPVFNIEGAVRKNRRNRSVAFENAGELTIRLEAGKVLGAVDGGIVAIYSKDAERLTGDTGRIGSGTIVSSDEFTATVKVSLKDAALRQVPADAQVTMVTPYFGAAKRVIALDSSPVAGSAEVMKKVAEIAGKENFVTTTEVPRPFSVPRERRVWDAAVVRMTYRDFTFGNRQPASRAATAPKETEEVYALTDRSNMPLYNFYVSVSAPDAAFQIAEALDKHVRVENIRTFGNAEGGLNDKLKLELIPIDARGPAPCTITPYTADRRRSQNGIEILTPGEYFYFQVTNLTGENMYVYLYSIAPSGRVSKIFPDPRFNVDTMLDDGVTVATLGNDRCFVFQVTSPEKTIAPYGLETFKLIATTKRIDYRILESPEIARGTRGDGSALSQLLAQASTNESTRGFGDDQEFSGWATTSLDIEIREKKP